MSSEDQGAREVCVFCRKRRPVARWQPFCSERCQLQDLARWTDGSYRIPGEELPEALETTSDNPPH